MMKRLLMLAACGLALLSCQETKPEADATANTTPPAGFSTRPQNYVALPGQAASASETASALDAYTRSPQQASPSALRDPAPLADPAAGLLNPGPVTPASSAPYALQIENGTSGKLFIEVTDDSGNIFPFGFMHTGQRINAQPQEPRLIVGRLTVVVRDPDRPNAPELRRYFITPPQGYVGQTLGIVILPGGRYRVTLQGQTVYTYPDPQQADAP